VSACDATSSSATSAVMIDAVCRMSSSDETIDKAEASAIKAKKFSPFSVDSLLSQRTKKGDDGENNNGFIKREEVREDKIDVCGDGEDEEDSFREEDEDELDNGCDNSSEDPLASSHRLAHPTALHPAARLASSHIGLASLYRPPPLPPGFVSLAWGAGAPPQFRSPPLAHHTGSECLALARFFAPPP